MNFHDKYITCKQTHIPQVDNSVLPCELYLHDSCVIVKDALPILGTTYETPLKKVIINMVNLLEKQGNIIKKLEERVDKLEKQKKQYEL